MGCSCIPSTYAPTKILTIAKQTSEVCTQLVTALGNAEYVTKFELPSWITFIPGMAYLPNTTQHKDAQNFADDVRTMANAAGCNLNYTFK